MIQEHGHGFQLFRDGGLSPPLSFPLGFVVDAREGDTRLCAVLELFQPPPRPLKIPNRLSSTI